MTTSDPTTITATPEPATSNPFLAGPFAPVREEVTVTELAVSGAIPDSLDGRYLRIGPNPVADPDPAGYNWFVGDGMVHGIRLREGRAEWYRNRWVRSPGVAEALGEPPPHRPVRGDSAFASNTSVIGHSGRTFALVEAGNLPYELSDELDTVGACDFDGTLPGGYTAHPHRDPRSGELHAVTYSVFGGRKVEYSVLGTDGRIRRTVDIQLDGNPLMHSFGLSENHVMLLDLPVTLDTAAIEGFDTAGDVFNGGRLPYSWDPDYRARVGVMPGDGGSSDVRWFEVEPCFVFHPLNAYEVRGTAQGPVERIVMEVVRFPMLFTSAARTQGPDNLATLDRWTIDLVSGRVREERLDDHPQEFPRLDERLVGHRHRYGYTVAVPGSTLRKYDLEAGTTMVHDFGSGDVPGEFVFVPASASSAEDDGWLMGLVQRGATNRSDLVLLDAGSLETVATVHLPVRVPYGFHGNWLPA